MHDVLLQLALNEATGAAFVPVGGGGGGGAGSVIVPPDPPEPFTRRSLFGDPPKRLESTLVVALPAIADATVAGVAPGLLWR